MAGSAALQRLRRWLQALTAPLTQDSVQRRSASGQRRRMRCLPVQLSGLLAVFAALALLGLLWPAQAAGSLTLLGLGALGTLAWVHHALHRLPSRPDIQELSEREHLRQKNRSLEILYEIATISNVAHDLDDLLDRSLRRLMGALGAQAATVNLLSEHGQPQVVKTLHAESGPARTPDPTTLGAVEYGGMVGVPLHYKQRNLGMLNLYTESPEWVERQDVQSMLTGIGRHLGGAIARMQLEEESRKLNIMQERNRIAHELHDSLAQTQASLRFRVRMLDSSLQSGGGAQAMHDLEQLEAILDQADTELRALIAHFRAPLESSTAPGAEFNLPHELETTLRSFREATGILTLFHQQGECTPLSPVIGSEVLRIIQEALANVRKHSQARTVRVMLTARRNPNQWQILVEDDGIGISTPPAPSRPGEHLGLSIMQERAQRINAELRIESEPGDGTRVELCLPK